MAGFCLPKEFTEKFVQALKSGDIVPEELVTMSSAERRAFLKDIVGEENVTGVNALLESKLILKDQKRGMVSWAKRVAGLSEPARRDLISRIERMDDILEPADARAFLEDLAAKRLGTEVTFEEAQNISRMTKELSEKREAIPDDAPLRSKERLDYGLQEVMLKEYVMSLKGTDGVLGMPFKEWITKPSAWFDTLAGTTKSVVASLDNSFVGRQGIKILYTHPSIWMRTFLKTWGDIGKELAGRDASLAVKADIASRPNALNRKYEIGKYDLGIKSEEAFPTSVASKVPLLGRLYKASEAAYNGAALRMRADYADYLIKKAEEFGVDTLNPEQARGIGKLVNSMTGRGAVDLLSERGSRLTNVALFSIKFLKANFDTLTGHRLGFAIEKGPARAFVRRQAAMNLMKIVATQAIILTIAEQLWPGSTERDPRSSNFGKIRIGDTRFDITGGMGSLVTLASRIAPTVHDGELGFWSKSGSSGKYTDLLAGKYGQQTALDVLEQFAEGKLSPLAGSLRDIWKGENFAGERVTAGSVVRNLVTPIPITTFEELVNNKDAAPVTAAMILDALGISTNTY